MTYYLMVNADGSPRAVCRRIDGRILILERYDRGTGEWVDFPYLLAASGIGGDDPFELADELQVKSVLKSWDVDLGVLKEGGKGSGWFAPPKGTHGLGSQGGSVDAYDYIVGDTGNTAVNKVPVGTLVKPEDDTPDFRVGRSNGFKLSGTVEGSIRDRVAIDVRQTKATLEFQNDVHNLSVTEIEPGPRTPQRFAWESDIKATWFGRRKAVAISAIEERHARVYGMFDGDELVGIAAMDDGPDFPSQRPGMDWATMLDGKQYVAWLATKRGGYGTEMLTHIRQKAAENGRGIYLYSTDDARGFYEHERGQSPYGGGLYYWEVLEELSREEIIALEPEDGVFAIKAPFKEGGPGSGWFAPPKGTHSKGSQGGPVIVDPDKQPTLPGMTPDRRQTRMEQAVAQGNIEDNGPRLEGGVTKPQPVTIYTDGLPIDGVFKGHHSDYLGRHDSYSEEAVQELSELLMRDAEVPQEAVPEHVLAEYKGEFGDIHRWIEGKPADFCDELDLVLAIEDAELNHDRIEVLTAIDVITYNTDRHGGNWLLDDDGAIWAMDHGHARWARLEADQDYLQVYGGPVWYAEAAHAYLEGIQDRDRLGRRVPTFQFRLETLNRWEKITREEFFDTFAPARDLVIQRRGSTRVDMDNAWFNFQKLIEFGEVVKYEP